MLISAKQPIARNRRPIVRLHRLVSIAVTALALHAVGQSRPTRAADDPPADKPLNIEQLAKLAEQRAPHVLAASYVLEADVQGDPLPGGGLIDRVESQSLIDLRDLRFAFNENRFHTAKPGEAQTWDPLGEREMTSWDLKSYMTYRPNTKTGSIADKLPGQNRFPARDVFVMACLFYPPTQNAQGGEEGSLVKLLRRGSLRAKTDEIDGRACQVVDVALALTVSATLWLDVERSLMPLKLQARAITGEVLAETHLEDPRQFTGGEQTVWLPLKVTTVTKIRKSTVTRVIEVDPAETKINPLLAEESFRLDFPAGTRFPGGDPRDK